MGLQVAANIVVPEVQPGSAHDERSSNGPRRKHNQLIRPRRYQGTVFDIANADRAVILDDNFLHRRVVHQGRAKALRLGNLRNRGAHQRIVLAGHTGVQPMPAENAVLAIGSGEYRLDAQRVGSLFVQDAGLVPVLADIAADAQDGFRFEKVTLEFRFRPAFDSGLQFETGPVDTTGTNPGPHVDGGSATHHARFPAGAGVDLVGLDHVHRVRPESRTTGIEGVRRLILAEIDLR